MTRPKTSDVVEAESKLHRQCMAVSGCAFVEHQPDDADIWVIMGLYIQILLLASGNCSLPHWMIFWLQWICRDTTEVRASFFPLGGDRKVSRLTKGARNSAKGEVVTHGDPYRYGSIPINTIFRGMNIHLPAILMFTRGTRFWHTAIYPRDSVARFSAAGRQVYPGSFLLAAKASIDSAGLADWSILNLPLSLYNVPSSRLT